MKNLYLKTLKYIEQNILNKIQSGEYFSFKEKKRSTEPKDVEFYNFFDELDLKKQTRIVFIGRDRSGKSSIMSHLLNYLKKDDFAFNLVRECRSDCNIEYYDYLCRLKFKPNLKYNELISTKFGDIPLVYRYSDDEFRSLVFSLMDSKSLIDISGHVTLDFEKEFQTDGKIKICFLYDTSQRKDELINQDKILTSIYDAIKANKNINHDNISYKLISTKEDLYPTQFEEFQDLSIRFFQKNIPLFTERFVAYGTNNFMYYNVFKKDKSNELENDYTRAKKLFDWILE